MTHFIQVNLGNGREAQDLLMQVAAEKNVDILLISEQYRKPETGIWFQDTRARAAIMVKNRRLNITQAFERGAGFTWVEIEGVRVYSCYFSPNEELGQFEKDLDLLEADIRTARGEVIVAGDFNSKSLDWGSRKTDDRGLALVGMLARLDLVVLNEGDSFTFRRRNTGSVIDVTMATNRVARRTSSWKVLEELTLSDHQYIEFFIDNEKKITPNIAGNSSHPRGNNMGTRWVLSKLDKSKMEEHIEEAKAKHIPWTSNITECPGKLVDYAISTITEACNISMPKRKSVEGRRRATYWWTAEIAELRKKCLSARRKATRHHEDEALSREYKQARKTLRIAIKNSKNKCWQELCREVDNDPWGLPYQLVTKKLRIRQKVPGLTDPCWVQQIVEALFPQENTPRRWMEDIGDQHVNLFTLDELHKAGRKIKTGKSPGPDGIPNEILKIILEKWPEMLLEVFNACLNQKLFPEQWKIQKLTLLRKGDKPLDSVSSYRPICLLDTLGKILERLLVQRLEEHLEAEGGLSHYQYGFRKGRSTVDAITRVIDTAKSVKQGKRQQKNFCALITLDIQNAFNTVRWEVVMTALELKKVPRYLRDIIGSYLDNRELIYETDDGLKRYRVSMGVPQGSVLGPLLWNMMYDEFLELDLPEQAYIVGFADDAAVVATAETTAQLEIIINDCMDRAYHWLNGRGFKLSIHKTEAVLITERRVFNWPDLVINGQEIKWSKSVTYLGMKLDERLTFTDHINMVVGKAASTAASLARLMPNVGGPREQKRRLLSGVVHAKLLYAAPIWADAMDSGVNRRKLLSIQRRSALKVIAAYRTVSESAVLVLASIPPIDLQVRERQEIYRGIRDGNISTDDITRKTEVKKRAREKLIEKWQNRWEEEETGRWTHRLIPNITAWIKRTHGEIGYYLTQAMTGHGKFESYLYRFKRTITPECKQCGYSEDDAEHTIFHCRAWSNERGILEETLGTEITVANLVGLMLDGVTEWNAVQTYVTKVLKEKERQEKERYERAQLPQDLLLNP